MNRHTEMTYPPLGTLKSVTEDVWVVDGPVIRFGTLLPKMPFPTRMTIIRIRAGGLFVHSPVPLSAPLKSALGAIGAVRWIIGLNRLHYWWIPEWRDAHPEASVYLAPR